MPQPGDIRSFNRGDKGTYKKIWQLCPDCGKGRWILKYQWDRGECKTCHPCYLRKHSKLEWWKPHYKEDNARWKGGRFLSKDGYVFIRIYEDNPFFGMVAKGKPGYILEHRLIMAQTLERCLSSKEFVHHKDGNRQNNKIENLELTTNKAHQKGYRLGYKNGWQDGIKYAQSL